MTTATDVLESFAILLLKHKLHMLLGNDEDDDYTCYNVLMYLLDRPNSMYKGSVYIPRVTNSKEPDVCASCFSSFGYTYGGRYRLGCHVCCDEDSARQALFTFARLTGLDIRQSETFLSNVIHKYLIGEDIS